MFYYYSLILVLILGYCANFELWCDFWARNGISGFFYKFDPPKINPTHLNNYVSGRGPMAKAMGRHDLTHNNYEPT